MRAHILLLNVATCFFTTLCGRDDLFLFRRLANAPLTVPTGYALLHITSSAATSPGHTPRKDNRTTHSPPMHPIRRRPASAPPGAGAPAPPGATALAAPPGAVARSSRKRPASAPPVAPNPRIRQQSEATAPPRAPASAPPGATAPAAPLGAVVCPQTTLPKHDSNYCPMCLAAYRSNDTTDKPRRRSHRPDGLCASHATAAAPVAPPGAGACPPTTLPKHDSNYCPMCLAAYRSNSTTTTPRRSSRRPDGLCTSHATAAAQAAQPAQAGAGGSSPTTLPQHDSHYCPMCLAAYRSNTTTTKPRRRSRRTDGLCASHATAAAPASPPRAAACPNTTLPQHDSHYCPMCLATYRSNSTSAIPRRRSRRPDGHCDKHASNQSKTALPTTRLRSKGAAAKTKQIPRQPSEYCPDCIRDFRRGLLSIPRRCSRRSDKLCQNHAEQAGTPTRKRPAPPASRTTRIR